MSGGHRKTGPKKKHAVPQGHRTVSMKLSTSVYERWCEFKVRRKLKTNDATAEYFLNLTEAFDEYPLPGYIMRACLTIQLLVKFLSQSLNSEA